MAKAAAKAADVGSITTEVAKAADVASTTGVVVALLVMVHVVSVVARIDPMEVLTTVRTTGANYSVGALVHVAFIHCPFLTTKKNALYLHLPGLNILRQHY